MILKGPGRGRAEDDLTAILHNLQDDYLDGCNDASLGYQQDPSRSNTYRDGFDHQRAIMEAQND